MNFKRSSFPMFIGAIICILVGLGLIVLCILVPSDASSDDEPKVLVGDNDPKNNSDDEPVLWEDTDVPSKGDEPESGGEASVNETPSAESEPAVGDISAESEPANDPVQSGGDSSADPMEGDPADEGSETASSKDDPLLILANVDNPLPEDFEVGELEQVQGNYYLDSRAASYAREMIAAAKKDGIKLQLCSAYRAKDLQQTLFTNKYNYYVQNGWDKEEAYAKTATIIAIPGTSEHQTGLCMDVVTPSYQVLDAGYAETDAAKWLAENAHEYGFILRYPKDKQEITKIIFEPWHYRFVGIENAKLIKDSGLCLEEYLETLE